MRFAGNASFRWCQKALFRLLDKPYLPATNRADSHQLFGHLKKFTLFVLGDCFVMLSGYKYHGLAINFIV
jgi:hypothetical protein